LGIWIGIGEGGRGGAVRRAARLTMKKHTRRSSDGAIVLLNDTGCPRSNNEVKLFRYGFWGIAVSAD